LPPARHVGGIAPDKSFVLRDDVRPGEGLLPSQLPGADQVR